MQLWPVKLNDETEFQVRWCGAADGFLWIDGLDISLSDAAIIFSDPTKTSHIVAYGTFEHDGYTKLVHLSIYDGLTKVALRKEV